MQIAIFVVIAAVALILMSRLLYPVDATGERPVKRERRSGFGDGDAFHAVSIQPAEGCCGVVESIKIQRFLSDEAPSLPLEGCGASDCRCRYVHHVDRRSGARDRRLVMLEDGDGREFWSQRDRRASLGRRQGDLLPA